MLLLAGSPDRPRARPRAEPARGPRGQAGPRRGQVGGTGRRGSVRGCAGRLIGAEVAFHPLRDMLTWFDLRVYAAAGHTVLHAPGMLYVWPMMPGFQFTYTPFAAMVFAAWTWLPWGTLTWLMTAASLTALGLAVWLTLGGLGWRGRRRLAGTLALSAVALWTEPVQRTLHLGQVELLLMALVIGDLCLADRRWWKGAGIGLAAGIKLVPLIFIPYLLLTRRFRQAVVATLMFGAMAGAGFEVLPQASRQWWLGPDFLRLSRPHRVRRVPGEPVAARHVHPAVRQPGQRSVVVGRRRRAGRGRRADHRRPGCTGQAGRCTAGSPVRSPG